MNVTFDHSEELTPRIRSFYFKPDESVRYSAGQFTEIYLPHASPDIRGEKRWFTLSSSPTEPLLAITTKHAIDHGSSFKNALWALQPGAKLTFAEPMGDMVLPKDSSRPIVFIAGGIGITPLHSMVKFLSDSDEQRTVRLLYAVEHEEDLIFSSLFRSYPMDFMPIVRTPSPAWAGEHGALTNERILKFAGEGRPLMFLSGPEPMVAGFSESLKASGITQDLLVTDSFPGYSQI